MNFDCSVLKDKQGCDGVERCQWDQTRCVQRRGSIPGLKALVSPHPKYVIGNYDANNFAEVVPSENIAQAIILQILESFPPFDKILKFSYDERRNMYVKLLSKLSSKRENYQKRELLKKALFPDVTEMKRITREISVNELPLPRDVMKIILNKIEIPGDIGPKFMEDMSPQEVGQLFKNYLSGVKQEIFENMSTNEIMDEIIKHAKKHNGAGRKKRQSRRRSRKRSRKTVKKSTKRTRRSKRKSTKRKSTRRSKRTRRV